MASPLYDADVIIIGSGVLGSLAAHAIAKEGNAVIMLEAGPYTQRWELVERFHNSPEKEVHTAFYPEQAWAPKSHGGPYSDEYLENTGSFEFKPGFVRLVGGTTWCWTAAAWRYLPQDMKLRSTYGVGRDWPINYDDLEPWYQKAEEALGVCGDSTENQSGKKQASTYPPRSAAYPLPPLGWSDHTKTFADTVRKAGFQFIDEPQARASRPHDGRPACNGNNSCASVCPTGAKYSGNIHAQKAKRSGAQVIENAVVFKLEVGENRKITGVFYKTPTGEVKRLSAPYVIVAANGIETPKLLLMSDAANSSDQVGRNLMDHAGMDFTFLAKDALWPGRGPAQQGAIMNWRDGSFRGKHGALKYALGNAVPNLAVAERLIQQGYWGQALNNQISHDAARWVKISTMFETLPQANNRITLCAHQDALGIPKPSVHYEVGNYTKAGAAIAQRDFKGFTTLFHGTVVKNDAVWQNRNHIMGTVIMGSDPKTSVVDGDCRTHDHPNLFLATTGVIPASGAVNPTLTGAALALRVAQTVCDVL